MSKEETKLCPFCNGKPVIKRYDHEHPTCYMLLPCCKMINHKYFNTEAEAIAAWNTRPTNPRIAELEGKCDFKTTVNRKLGRQYMELQARIAELEAQLTLYDKMVTILKELNKQIVTPSNHTPVLVNTCPAIIKRDIEALLQEAKAIGGGK